jgi:hypothetical protein
MELINNIRKNTPSIIFGQEDFNEDDVFYSNIKFDFHKKGLIVNLETNNQLIVSGEISTNFKSNEKDIFKSYDNCIIIRLSAKQKKFTLCKVIYNYIGIITINDDIPDGDIPPYKMDLYGIYPLGIYVKDYRKVGTYYSNN